MAYIKKDEMIGACIQIATNILNHIPLNEQPNTADEVIDETKQYIVETYVQA